MYNVSLSTKIRAITLKTYRKAENLSDQMTQLRNQLLSHGNGHGVGSLYLRKYSEAGRIITPSVIFSVTFSKSSFWRNEV
jgi:virulence-associated protein VapD